MSFGSAASAPRGTRPGTAAPCPCGGAQFGECCGPILAGAPAPTAERLMRSRYTAFAIGDPTFLSDSWWPRTRPGEIDLDPSTAWIGLVVETVAEDGDTGTVRFRAQWRERRTGERGTLVEHSRFVRRLGRWYYVGAV